METTHKAGLDDDVTLKRWNLALGLLAWGGIAWAVFSIVTAFAGAEFTIGVDTKSGLKVLTADDFSTTQRVTLVMIALPQVLSWLYCLWQIVRLSSHFSTGAILSIEMVQCLERFGYGLAAQAACEVVYVPVMVAYLIGQKKIESIENLWEQIVGGGVLTSLLAAVLIVVVTRILRIGIRLREEVELTI